MTNDEGASDPAPSNFDAAMIPFTRTAKAAMPAITNSANTPEASREHCSRGNAGMLRPWGTSSTRTGLGVTRIVAVFVRPTEEEGEPDNVWLAVPDRRGAVELALLENHIVPVSVSVERCVPLSETLLVWNKVGDAEGIVV